MGGKEAGRIIYDEHGPARIERCRWSKRVKIPRRLRKQREK